jgi:predicted metal-dependent enzyme (double-stranded beta helix superfamily)
VNRPASGLLQGMIEEVRRLYAEDMDEPGRWSRISQALETALADPDLQAAARSWPKSHDRTNNRYTNLLFYEDPDFGFVINGLVKDETGCTPVHDHGHAWVAYGLLEGDETVLRYREPPAEGAASTLEPTERISLAAGSVDLVPPWTFHAEQADTDRTVAVMVRSARVGKFAHRRLNPGTGETYDHPGPAQIPYNL